MSNSYTRRLQNWTTQEIQANSVKLNHTIRGDKADLADPDSTINKGDLQRVIERNQFHLRMNREELARRRA